MVNTTIYKGGYIHEVYPDHRYPQSAGRSPRYQAQVGHMMVNRNTYVGAQRAITQLLRTSTQGDRP